MGIRGAAVGTVLAWAVRAAVLGWAFLDRDLGATHGSRAGMRFSPVKTAGLVRVGGPTALSQFSDIGSWVVFMNLILPLYGTIATAASNVALQLMHLSFMPAFGLGLALSSQVGHALGEGRPEIARMRARVAFRIAVGYMGGLGAIYLLARGPMVRAFNPDPAVVRAGGVVMVWAAAFQLSDALCAVYSSALRGAGDTRVPAIFAAANCWIVFVAGSWAAARWAPGWGLSGPWGACTAYITFLGVFLALRWRSGAWMKIRLFDEGEPQVKSAEGEAIVKPADGV
jgi:MATE family multidrug resistance protein